MWRRERRAQRGFTLLEVLVAFSVTALFLVLLPSTVAGVRRIADSAERNRAWLLAQSELEAYGARRSLEVGRYGGEQAGLAWELEVSTATPQQMGAAAVAPDPTATVALRQLRLRVRRAREREALLELTARRLYLVR
ncbi:MAG: prepilin-type N-terminal cleavage/methylation domain-containing protein [Pseudomonadota bacterium]